MYQLKMCQNTILPDLNAVDYFPNTIYFQTCAVINLIRKISREMYNHTPGKIWFTQHRVISPKYTLV